jgi:POT family proton-dependent oligopeptide transporter
MGLLNVVVVAGIVVTILTGIPVLRQMRSHPRGLIILFFAEMWERFSYYGMRALLIFYLTQHFLFSDDEASGLYGSYTSLVYLLPLVGGVLADRYIGTRKAIAFGALLLVAGHGLMAYEGRENRQFLEVNNARYEFQVEGRGDGRETRLLVNGAAYEVGPGPGEGTLAIQGLPPGGVLPPVLPAGSFETVADRDGVAENVFYFALSLIIMGVGFLKPNISTIVGQLYPQGDPRRDPGFTLYYYGINLGAFWAAVLCGLLGQTVGWWAGFGLAGVGMLLGFVVFVLNKPALEGHGEPPDPVKLKQPFVGPVNREWMVYLAGVAGVFGVWGLVRSNELVGVMLTAGIVASLAAVLFILLKVCKTLAERQRLLLAMVLVFGAVVFFTLFEQAGSSLNLFADRNVNLPSDGFLTITASQTQSFNAGFILLFAPVFAAIWARLGRQGRDPHPLIKFGLGLAQVGLGFLIVVWAAGFADENARLPLIFLALLYLFHTTGELFLSPVGLSEITKLAPVSVVSFLMAVWFLSSSIAQYVGGWIAGLAGTETVGGQVLDPAAALRSSLEVFNALGWAGVIAGAIFLGLYPLLKGWSHGVHDPRPVVGGEGIAPAFDGDRQGASAALMRADRNAPGTPPAE